MPLFRIGDYVEHKYSGWHGKVNGYLFIWDIEIVTVVANNSRFSGQYTEEVLVKVERDDNVS